MTETAMSFVRVQQEVQGRGARFEQLRNLVHTKLMREIEAFQTKLENEGVRIAQVTREYEQFSTDIGNPLGVCIDEQEDQKEMIRHLARQVEALQGGTNPGTASSENNVTSESVPSDKMLP